MIRRGGGDLRLDVAQEQQQHDYDACTVLAVDAMHQDGVVLQLDEGAQRQGHAPLGVLQQRLVQRLVTQQQRVGYSRGHHGSGTCISVKLLESLAVNRFF